MHSPLVIELAMSETLRALRNNIHASLDIIPSQLGPIVELITPPPEQCGWLVQELVNAARGS